jgi:hypothetical protein
MSLACSAAGVHAESFFQVEADIGGAAYVPASDGLWVKTASNTNSI